MTRRRGLRRVGRPAAAVRSVVMCFMGCSPLEIDSRVVGDHRFDAFTVAETRPLVIGAVPRERRGQTLTNTRGAAGSGGSASQVRQDGKDAPMVIGRGEKLELR